MNNSINGDKFISSEHHIVVYAYYNMEWRSFNMSLHSHDRIEIMYLSKGSCNIVLKDKIIPMHKGDYILLDANVYHKLEINEIEPCRILNVEFGFENGASIIDAAKLMKLSDSINTLREKLEKHYVFKDIDDVGPILKRLIKELNESNIYESPMVNLLVYELLETIGRYFKSNEDNVEDSVVFYIQKAIKYINDNLSRELRISDIAKQVSIHPNYLQRIFKKQTDDTLMDYVQKQRVKKAEILLVYTDISIIDLALELGFGSRQYFSYVFKRHKNLSPQEFRKHYCRNTFYD
jgi:AraC-like DNA-binding protein/mannose-6-phosphate isomerase-like protein (cupin superfamily)